MGVFIVTAIGAVLVALLGLWSARIAKQELDASKRQAEALAREKEKIAVSVQTESERNRTNQPSTGAWDALASGKGQSVSHPR
jgi:hypothetical protein